MKQHIRESMTKEESENAVPMQMVWKVTKQNENNDGDGDADNEMDCELQPIIIIIIRYIFISV